jgi:hypothetical protein
VAVAVRLGEGVGVGVCVGMTVLQAVSRKPRQVMRIIKVE